MASIPVPTEERVGGRTPGQELRLPLLRRPVHGVQALAPRRVRRAQVRRLSVEDTEGYMARAARPYYALSGDRGIRFESLEVRGVARWAGDPVPAPRPCARAGSKRRLAHRGLLCSLPVEVRDRCGHVLVGGEEGAGPFRSLEFRAAEHIVRATPRRPPRVGRRTPCAARAPRSSCRPGSSPPGRLTFRRDPSFVGSPLPVARSPFRSSREYRPRLHCAQAVPRCGC